MGNVLFFANDFFSKSGAKTLHVARRRTPLRSVCAASRARRPTDAGPHCPHPRNTRPQKPHNSALQAFLHLRGKNSLHSARRSASLHRSSMNRPATAPEGAERRIQKSDSNTKKRQSALIGVPTRRTKTHLHAFGLPANQNHPAKQAPRRAAARRCSHQKP
jgi:hypothetical protein